MYGSLRLKEMKIFRFGYLAALSAGLVLAGCSTPPPTVDLSDPSKIKTQLSPNAQQAVLVLKSNGQPMVVNFNEEDATGTRKKLGNVFDAEDLTRQLLPGIVRMIAATNRTVYDALPVREVLIDASGPMRIVGNSTWSDTSGTKQTGYATRSGSCGPLYSSFRPEPMKRYMVRFSFIGKGCVQQVFDITADNAVLVAGQPLPTQAEAPQKDQ